MPSTKPKLIVRVPEEVIAFFRDSAAAEARSVSSLVAELLTEYYHDVEGIPDATDRAPCPGQAA